MSHKPRSDIVFKKLSEAPDLPQDESAVEYILVIDDAGASQLTDDLKLIFDHLDEDIRIDKELEELQEGFKRLAKVLAESKPDFFKVHSDVGQTISAKKSNVRLHCCAICQKPFVDQEKLLAHADDQLHLNVELQKFYLYSCKFCDSAPFKEPVNLVDHFRLRHEDSVNGDGIGKKFDKVTVVQMFTSNPEDVKKQIEILGNGVLLPPDAFERSAAARKSNGMTTHQNLNQSTSASLQANSKTCVNHKAAVKRSLIEERRRRRINVERRHTMTMASMSSSVSMKQRHSSESKTISKQKSDSDSRKSSVSGSPTRARTIRFCDIRNHHILTEIAVFKPKTSCPDELVDESLPRFRTGGNLELRDEFNVSDEDLPHVASETDPCQKRKLPHDSEKHPEWKIFKADEMSLIRRGFVNISSMVSSPNNSATHFNLTVNTNGFKTRNAFGGKSISHAEQKLNHPVNSPTLKFEVDFSGKAESSPTSSVQSLRKPFYRVENNALIIA